MKKNKTLAKIITIAMCAAMTATALTACGSTQTASSLESSVQSESTPPPLKIKQNLKPKLHKPAQ